jgi:RNA polymerase sigma factor (sigma-70 family)
MLLDATHSRVAYTALDIALPGWPGAYGRGYEGVDVTKTPADRKSVKIDKVASAPINVADFTALMQRVRDHQDRAAFAQVFQYYAPRVKAFLMKSGSDAALAEELAQDVMATVWQKSAQFDPARASLATWIFTIARNRRIDYFRRARRPEPESLDWGNTEEPDQADVYETAQETRRLTEALSSLPDAQRAMIERAFYGDLSHGEIASETGLPLGTIKSRIRLALDRLRQTMSK